MTAILTRSTGVFLAFNDVALPARPLTVVIQKRSDTNQEGQPQSLAGAFQPTAAMKAQSLDGLILPKDNTSPITPQDRELIVQAVAKECGEVASLLVREVVTENARAVDSAKPGALDLVLDFINEKGRWVRTFVVVLGEKSRESVQSSLVKPAEVKEFAFVTSEDLPRVREFKPEEKTPIQRGGSGVPASDIAGFLDDCQALKKILKGK